MALTVALDALHSMGYPPWMSAAIRWLREREVLSVGEFARLTGLSAENIRAAELGLEPPSEALEAIAAHFGFWPEELSGAGSPRVQALIAFHGMAGADGIASGSLRRLGEQVGIGNPFIFEDMLFSLRAAGWLADDPFERNILFDRFSVRLARPTLRSN